MKTVQSYLAVLPLVLIICVETGVYATKCYACNSGSKYEKELCADPFDVKVAEENNFLVDCDQVLGNTGMNFTYCRKMSQTVSGETRILRQCASHVRLDRCIERTGTKDIKLKYCDCEGDACNTAPPVLAINVILMFTVSALLALLFHS
jgi:hypothetical protein